MKKVMSVIMVACMAMGLSLFAGCKVQPEQIKVVAQSAGLFSAVGWIAMDNPDEGTVSAVKIVLATIQSKSSDVGAGATYTEVIYPEVVKVIDSDVINAQYRPACKAGALSLLGGMDMLFAAHPEWKAQQELAIQVVGSFITGVNNGLGLKADDPIIEAARTTASRRARVYKK